MFCPRCGAEAPSEAKYCSSCGADLPSRERDRGGGARTDESGDRLGALVGRSRSARMVTAGIVVALAIALVAFIALPSDDGEEVIPQDAYSLAADELCVEEKQAIVAAGQEALKDGEDRNLAAYAGGLVPIAVEWRSRLNDLAAPSDRAEVAQDLSLALREVAVEAGALARLARGGTTPEAVAQARRVDVSTAEVEQAIDGLGLVRCGGLAIKLTGAG